MFINNLCLYSELSISLVDNKLAISVAKSIGKAVQMYVNQCEQRVSFF